MYLYRALTHTHQQCILKHQLTIFRLLYLTNYTEQAAFKNGPCPLNQQHVNYKKCTESSREIK